MNQPTRTAPIHLSNAAPPDEAAAVRAAAEGQFWPRFKLAFSALRRLLADPNDTQQVFVLSIAMNAGKLPDLMARFLSTEDGVELLNQRAAIDASAVDYDALRQLPADTLGGAYARFLDRHDLDANMFKPPPGLPAAPAYIVQRLRQTHDLWHVLTGYSPEVSGELPLLGFTYGQTGVPSMGLLALTGTVRFAVDGNWIGGEVMRGYRRGRQAAFLANQPWEQMWELPLAEVRAQLDLTDSAV